MVNNIDIDAILEKGVTNSQALPGVAAVATDRKGTIYSGAAGKRCLGKDPDMTTDTVCAIFSTTKAITSTAALTFIDDGNLYLNQPAKNYVPEIANIQVLEGFGEDGNPKYRPAKRDITIRMLLLHTAGFGYSIFNEDYQRLVTKHGLVDGNSALKASLKAPLLFDPGESWEYGMNIDWIGHILETIASKRLGEICQERVFDKLGMQDTSFLLTDEMAAKRAVVHKRERNGNILALKDFTLPMPPEMDMGGHGLYSTAEDYSKFIRMWLNDGDGPFGRVLNEETVAMASKNGLDKDMQISKLQSANPDVNNMFEYSPGTKKTWGMSFMINEEPAATGRPAGCLSWAGLANSYFWIDRKNGVGAFWTTQLLPFADLDCINCALDFESAIYKLNNS